MANTVLNYDFMASTLHSLFYLILPAAQWGMGALLSSGTDKEAEGRQG